MKCPVCEETELEGDLAVDTQQADITIISIFETAPRNWICCDSCNRIVCNVCCTHPRSGYCDSCIELYNLHEYIKGIEAL